MGGAYKSLRYRALCLMYRVKFELYQPVSVMGYAMGAFPWQRGLGFGSAGLSGENLRSFCLAGSDDNGAEPRSELCSRDPAADGRRAPPSATA